MKSKLITVNRGNKPAINRARFFNLGGSTASGTVDHSANINGGNFSLSGLVDSINPGINTDAIKEGASNLDSQIGLLSNFAGEFISSGYHSHQGDTIRKIGAPVAKVGGMIGQVLLPGTGSLFESALSSRFNIIGAGIDRIAGSKLNQGNIDKAKSEINNLFSSANSLYKANDTDDFAKRLGNINLGYDFTQNDIGKDAKFGHKAKDMYNSLHAILNTGKDYAKHGIIQSIEGLNRQQKDNFESQFKYDLGGPLGFGPGSLGIMQQDKYYDTINNRSDAIASKGQQPNMFSAKTFDFGGLKASFLDEFGKDPIGAAVRYNQGLEALAAQREAEQIEAAREAEYADMQKRVLNLETENQGLQALMAAVPQSTTPVIPEIPESSFTPSQAASSGYSNLKDSIKMSEGFLDRAYTLGNEKHPTIGYGFYGFYPGTNRRVKAGDVISREEADRYLDAAIEERERELAAKVPNWDKMAQYQRDALIDLAYNAGSSAPHFRKNSKLMRALENEDWDAASRQLATTSSDLSLARGMQNRSNRRINMFVNGDYGIKAFGGELGTNGTDWTNGLLYIDNGGSHEENPLEGVPMGFDPEGVPNLVEEGETIWNDYVFSDRIKVPKKLMKELGLGGSMSKDITFAEASKKLGQESKQRPNDPISLSGLDAAMSRLAEVQEAERMKNQMREYVGLAGYACGGKMNKCACGGKLNKYAEGSKVRKGNTGLNTYKFDPIDQFKYWDREANDYDEGYRDFIENKLNEDWIARAMSGQYGDMSRYKGANNISPTVEQAWQLGLDQKNSDWHKAMAQAYDEYLAGIDPKTGLATASPDSVNEVFEMDPYTEGWEKRRGISTEPVGLAAAKEASETEGGQGTGKANTYPTWMRYAPVFGAGIMSLTDALGLTNKPDYTMADSLQAAAERAGYAPNISYKPIGDYIAYRPMDIWYEQNRLNANARATDRALTNNAAPIGTKMAGLLADGYNNQIALGNLYRQALEYNDAKRKDVADFNRKTNMFNSQMELEASMANAKYGQEASKLGLSGLAQAAALRDAIDQRVGAARAANLSNLFNSLGDIGRENFAMNQINTDRSRRYYGDLSGHADGYKSGKSRACGGRMKRCKK